MTAFVDSSAWYAAADADDADHATIKRVLQAIAPLLTTDHVLLESWFLMNRRLGRRSAETFVARSIAGGLAIEMVTRADIEKAVDVGKAFADHGFSIVDRTSFAVMERLGITDAIALDDDFAVYRYGPRRRQAFNVIR